MLGNKKTRDFVCCGLFLGMLAMVYPLQAQESGDNGQGAVEGKKAEQKKTPAPVAMDKAAVVHTEETFTPTEDISEDLAVSYPVDI